MRFVATAFWAILVGTVISYVLTSMSGASFDIVQTLVFAAIIFIAVAFIGDGVLKGNEEQEQ